MAVRAATSAGTDEGEGSAVQRGVMHGVDDAALANAFWRETAIKSAGGATLMMRRETQREAHSRQGMRQVALVHSMAV